jgi:SpoVK/Ycf46/Vps4 family AAA+-type ATPase
MSGSDIKEACRDAAMGPVREFIRKRREEGTLRNGRAVGEGDVRGLRTEDFFGRGRGLRDLQGVDDTREEMNSRVRQQVHTTEEEESSESEDDDDEDGGKSFTEEELRGSNSRPAAAEHAVVR